MSDSIAKLSVIITGDASPLGRATAQADGYVRAFERSTGSAMLRAGESAKAMGNAFSVASGNLGKLSSLASLGWVGAIVAATVAAGKLAFNLAAISDELEVAAGGNKLDTWAGQFDRVQAAATSIAQTLGRPIAEFLTHETEQLANVLELIADSIMPDYIRAEQERAKLLEEQKKKEKEIADQKEKAAKAAKAAAEEQARELERIGRDLQSRADAIAKSIRTPREELVGALAEAQMLFDRGFLTAQQYERAAQNAGRAFANATRMDRPETRESAVTPLVGAATRWTTEGFSALQEARQAQQRQAEVERQQLEEQRKANEILEEMRDQLEDAGLSPGSAAIVVEEVSW